MTDHENVGLNEMMDRDPRSRPTIVDLTGNTPIINNNEPANNTPRVRAVPMQTGPINMDNLKPVDINTILPKREPEPSALETNLFAEYSCKPTFCNTTHQQSLYLFLHAIFIGIKFM